MRRVAALGGAALAALPVGAATADELLVMPYACAMFDGRPVLTPAPDQGHPIVGRREQRMFTACSPVDSTVCRTWTVHRFTLDCGGVRLPWTAVATAAGGPGQRRARLVDGRVQLSMPARWVLAPDDPCARGADFGDRWRYGRLGTYCADRMALSPPAVVDMPAGFAPMFGIDAIFVPQGHGRGPLAGAPWTATTAEAARSKSAAAGAQAPQRQPEQASAKPELARAKTPAQPKERAAEATSSVTGSPAGQDRDNRATGGPRIINVPEPAARAAKSSPTPEQATPSTTMEPTAVEVPKPVPAVRPSERHLAFAAPLRDDDEARSATGSISPTAAAAGKASVPAGGRAAGQPRDPTTFVVDIVSAAGQPAVTIATGIAALFALLLLALAIRRQGGRTGRDPLAQRDIGSISLDGGALDRARAGQEPAAEPLRLPPPAGNSHTSAPPPAPSPPTVRAQPAPASGVVASAPPPEPKRFQTEVPQTREEALRVLGMGVRPEAGDMALKKIVDGLRLTWHPDNAVDELDRLEREIRLKQINAAWEIITGKREETPQPRKPPPLPQRENAA
jgi:hypothetical protein